jgi:hypothetical protein
MDEDPSNEAFILSYSRGTAWTKPRPWKQNPPPPRTEDWLAKYLAWID